MDGPQKIFNLHSSVVSDERRETKKESPKQEDEEQNDEELLRGFDLDFFGDTRIHAKKTHVFGQVQVHRGFETEKGKFSRPSPSLHMSVAKF